LWILSGNANDPADVGMCHWKSSLFFLTPALALELDYPERGPYARQSSSPYGLSVAHMTISENAGERCDITAGRTDNRISKPTCHVYVTVGN